MPARSTPAARIASRGPRRWPGRARSSPTVEARGTSSAGLVAPAGTQHRGRGRGEKRALVVVAEHRAAPPRPRSSATSGEPCRKTKFTYSIAAFSSRKPSKTARNPTSAPSRSPSASRHLRPVEDQDALRRPRLQRQIEPLQRLGKRPLAHQRPADLVVRLPGRDLVVDDEMLEAFCRARPRSPHRALRAPRRSVRAPRSARPRTKVRVRQRGDDGDAFVGRSPGHLPRGRPRDTSPSVTSAIGRKPRGVLAVSATTRSSCVARRDPALWRAAPTSRSCTRRRIVGRRLDGGLRHAQIALALAAFVHDVGHVAEMHDLDRVVVAGDARFFTVARDVLVQPAAIANRRVVRKNPDDRVRRADDAALGVAQIAAADPAAHAVGRRPAQRRELRRAIRGAAARRRRARRSKRPSPARSPRCAPRRNRRATSMRAIRAPNDSAIAIVLSVEPVSAMQISSTTPCTDSSAPAKNRSSLRTIMHSEMG